jgi:hypothetical protein
MWLSSIAERRRRRQAQALRRAVAELPVITRRAMLAAIDSEELIVGAYSDRRGRACPMLAAHRRGARTDVGRFPRAWDEFGGASRPRPATTRELQILKALLQESFSELPSDSLAPVPAKVSRAPEPPLAPLGRSGR